MRSDQPDRDMNAIPEEKIHPRVRNRRVHMANERTFLAWIRTSIGIMAFGFVVEKFALLIQQAPYFAGTHGNIPAVPASHGYSSFLGILLIGIGAFMGALAFVRYKKVEKQIDTDSYHPSLILDIMLTASILSIGIFLVLYLIHSI